ncbi:MAG: hypothetical protein NTZ34_05960 [Chloroflexi bacterium]|nr:hypothetical protein [Chloroflexota bacterium]
MVYGTVYKIPDAIGEFDICTLGSILLHLRDPFLALQQVSAHTKETIVITDMLENLIENNATSIPSNRRLMRFLPDSATCEPWETWWHMSPELVIEFIKILGFKNTTLSYHKQLYQKTACELYTIVGHRKD